MKSEILIALLVLAAPALALTPVPECEYDADLYLAPHGPTSRMTTDCAYRTSALQVIQKLEGGYLVQVAPMLQDLDDGTDARFGVWHYAFLKTGKPHGNQVLEFVEYDGPVVQRRL